jgi:hypothetical protein
MSSIESAGKFLQKHGVGETPDFSEIGSAVYMIGFEPSENSSGMTQCIDYLDDAKVLNNCVVVIKKMEKEIAVWLYNDDDPVEYEIKNLEYVWNGAMKLEQGPYLVTKRLIDDATAPLEKAKQAAEKKVTKALTNKTVEWKTVKKNKMVFKKVAKTPDTVALKKISDIQVVVAEKSSSPDESLLPAAKTLQEAINDLAPGQEAVAMLRKEKASHLFVSVGGNMACISFLLGKGAKKAVKDVKTLIPKAKKFLAAA